MFDHVLKFDPAIYISLGAILGIIGLKVFEFLMGQYRDRSQEYRTAYAKFAETFTPYLQELEIGESTLNVLIIGEFPKHDLAMRDFFRHVKRFSRRRFMQKWYEYKSKYDQINSMGKIGGFPIGVVTALAPPGFDLRTTRPSPGDMIQWELDRKRELRSIIHELLKIAEP
jgi:hypothetical protein